MSGEAGETDAPLPPAIARVLAALERRRDEPGESVAAGRPGTRFGAYALVRLVARGGMGEVWEAERADGAVAQRVAIKLPHAVGAHFGARLLGERRILAQLSHPNVARFLDAGASESGVPYLVLEYVEGRPIDRWCDEQRLGLRARLDLLVQACRAVEHAHQHLIVHRDLKPSNVMVDAAGQVKLLDFGIAKLLDDTDPTRGATALTPAYAAPEQLEGGAVSTVTDVYALGLLLHRLLTGTLPQGRESGALGQVLAELRRDPTVHASRANPSAEADPPIDRRELAGDLDAIVAQCLRADPGARYGSVAALRADLEAYLEGRPIQARPRSFAYVARRFVTRHRAGATLTGLALAAIVALGVVATQRTLEALRSAQRAQAARALLTRVFLSADPYHAGGADTRAVDLLQHAASQVGEALREDPAGAAELLDQIGQTFVSLDQREQADAALVAARDAALRADPPLPALAAHADARVAYYAVKVDGRQAEDVRIDRAIATLRALRPVPSAELYDVLELKADLAIDRGDSATVEPLSEEMLVLARATEGDNVALAIERLGSIASIERTLGRKQQALARAREAYELAAAHRGEVAPSTRLYATQQYAAALNQNDREPEALKLLEAAATEARAAGVPDSLRGGITYDLSAAELGVGRFEDAAAGLRTLLPADGVPKSGNDAMVMAQLGKALGLMGRHADAVMQLESATKYFCDQDAKSPPCLKLSEKLAAAGAAR